MLKQVSANYYYYRHNNRAASRMPTRATTKTTTTRQRLGRRTRLSYTLIFLNSFKTPSKSEFSANSMPVLALESAINVIISDDLLNVTTW